MALTDPIRNKEDIHNMAAYWLEKGSPRNHLLVVLGVHSILRIGDLLSLTWGDVCDFTQGAYKKHIFLLEKKTGKEKRFPLHKDVVKALGLYLASLKVKPSAHNFIFAPKGQDDKPICRSQAWKIIKEAALAVGAEGNIACHSLRKTFGYHAWQESAQPALLMDIYNHTSFATTQRYLGITQDNRDRLYLGVDFFQGERTRKSKQRLNKPQGSMLSYNMISIFLCSLLTLFCTAAY
jgi:integrase